MHSLHAAVQEVGRTRQVRVISDAALVQKVATGGATSPTIRPIDQPPGPNLHRPIDVLHELARAGSAVLDPDLEPAQRHWATLKYLTYFAPGREQSVLRVSARGRSLRYTLRRTASEELGEAFSIALGKRWFAHHLSTVVGIRPSPTIYCINLENDLSGALMPWWQLGVPGYRPDFLLIADISRELTSVAVAGLESKGSGNAAAVPSQLRHAVQQLDSLSSTAGVSLGCAVSTVSGVDMVTSYGLQVRSNPLFLDLPKKPRSQSREGALLDALMAALADFSSSPAADRMWSLRRDPRPRAAGTDRSSFGLRVDAEDRSFEPEWSEFQTAVGSIRVGTGVAAPVVDALEAGEPARVAMTQRLPGPEDSERSEPGRVRSEPNLIISTARDASSVAIELPN